jgi:hypothetical protein
VGRVVVVVAAVRVRPAQATNRPLLPMPVVVAVVVTATTDAHGATDASRAKNEKNSMSA